MAIVAKVSPKYTGDYLKGGDIGRRIDVHEDRIQNWFLAHAKTLATTPDGQFAALNLALAYFESYEVLRSGLDSTSQSRTFFRCGFLDVFAGPYKSPTGGPAAFTPEKVADFVYENARCGLEHTGMSRFGFAIGGSAPFTVSGSSSGAISAIFVNVVGLVEKIDAHFTEYVTRLRDPNNASLRAAFTASWERYNPETPLTLPNAPLP